jgi:AraC-like DNA-binding protein
MATRDQDDMTSAAVVALMQHAFARQKINVADLQVRQEGAIASLGDKVALSEHVRREHGAAPLLDVGASIASMAGNPLAAALLAARDGPDLFARWNRMERYVHRRHPIVMRHITRTSAVLHHVGDPADPPSVAMNYVLAGLFAHLLAAIGYARVDLAIGNAKRRILVLGDTEDADADVEDLVSEAETGLWHFRWNGMAPRSLPAPAGPCEPATLHPRVAKRVAMVIAQDLLRSWPLAELAAQLGLSCRTLQRRLQQEGQSIRAIRRNVQVDLASRHLLSSSVPLASVGFAAGFSDLPHFTRAFRKAVGMPPAAFRALSSVPKRATVG